MKKYKVKIKKSNTPYMAYGGQTGFGLDTGSSKDYQIPEGYDYNNHVLNTTLSPVDREGANIEAEKGETIVADFNYDGNIEHLKVGGKKHSQGGTPLNVPDDAFVFSDAKKLRMKGSEVTAFGKSEDSKKSFTPAELAKQYDLNKYQAILNDPKSDNLSRETAELMVSNYERKLAQLALVQEAKKGFPQGIPDMAMTYLQTMQMNTGEEVSVPEEIGSFEMGGSLKKFVTGGSGRDYDIDPYKGGKTRKGTITPTGKNNAFSRGKDYLQSWESIIPGISKLSNAEAQSRIYDYTLQNNPEAIRNMWSSYGMTAKGLRDKNLNRFDRSGKFSAEDLNDNNLQELKSAYADGFFGVRQLDPMKELKAVDPRYINPTPITPPKISFPNPVPRTINSPSPTPEVPVPGDYNPTGTPGVFDYMTPDKLSFVAGLRNRSNIKKYMPWEAPVTMVQADPTFYDPNRELASNAEQMNTQMMYNSMFSGPQALGSRNSAVAGNAATNTANILSKYNTQNVGVANQFAGINADIMNRLTDAQGQRATRLYDKTTIANQQYDNAIAQADNQILKAGINAWDNRSQLSMVNDTNPYYNVDPTTGRMVFKSGKSISGSTPSTGSSSPAYQQFYNEALKQGMDDEYAKRYAFDMIKGNKATYNDKNNDGYWDAVKAQSSQYTGIVGPRN